MIPSERHAALVAEIKNRISYSWKESWGCVANEAILEIAERHRPESDAHYCTHLWCSECWPCADWLTIEHAVMGGAE